jgi:hypothetical protein
MEMVLVGVLFALGAAGIMLIRIARRLYGRPHRPGKSESAEQSFLRSLLVQPPPKPPSLYTLSHRSSPPEPSRSPGSPKKS